MDQESSTDNAEERKSRRLTFHLAAIESLQGVIRGIDTKISFILVLLGLPLAGIDKIPLDTIMKFDSWWYKGLLLGIGVIIIWLWIIAFYYACFGIFSLRQPDKLFDKEPRKVERA